MKNVLTNLGFATLFGGACILIGGCAGFISACDQLDHDVIIGQAPNFAFIPKPRKGVHLVHDEVEED